MWDTVNDVLLERMSDSKHTSISLFLRPLLISLLLTPFCLLLGILSAGAGHGDYILATILFPFTLLSVALYHTITDPFILFGVVQVPLYGVILGWTNMKGKIIPAALILCVIHTLAVAISFLLVHDA